MAKTASPGKAQMAALRAFTGPLLQLSGNLVKGLFFAVHVVFPALRFEIPKAARPLFSTAAKGPIPKIVWQTNFSRKVALAVYANYLFNRLMAPTHEFRMLDDEDAAEFVQTSCSDLTWQNYRRLQIGAARADFWRLLTLYQHGGVYMDVDATLMWPLSPTLGTKSEAFMILDSGELTNFFLAAAPGNVRIESLIDAVNRNISENTIKSVYALTGPSVFDAVLAGQAVGSVDRPVCRQGILTNEFFQYIDRPGRKWHREEKTVPIIGDR